MREMKPSTMEWIGDIPVSWKVMPNKYLMHKKKEICPVYNGEDILSLTMKGVIVRDLDAGGKMPTSFDGYQRLEPGNLLMCLFDIDVTPRCIGLIKQTGLSSPAYSQFVLCDDADAAYYCYYYTMLDNDKALLHLAKNLRHSLTEDQLGAIPVIVPPTQEQQRIADFLDAKCAEIDALTADIQTQIDTLEQYKRSVITETVTKGLNSNVEMKDSGIEWIGKIPSGWQVIRIKYLLNERNSRSIYGEEEPLSMSQKHGLIPTKEMDNVPHMAATNVGAKLAYVNDLVFNKLKAHLGVFSVSRYEGLVSPDYSVYYSKGNCNIKYLEYLFKTDLYINEFRKKITGVGAGLSRLYTSGLFDIFAIYPPMFEQDKIAEYLMDKIDDTNRAIGEKKQQLEILAAYKKSLIFEYVTGKKEVLSSTPSTVVALDPHIILLGIINDRIGKKCVRGKVQLQKLLYLMDAHVGITANTQYYRYEHGPYDRQLDNYIETLVKNKWYQRRSENSEILVKGKKHDEFAKKFKNNFRSKQPEISRLVDALKDMKTSQLERIATLFAVWNDFILEGKLYPTDEMIINEVITNWTQNKANPKYSTWKMSLEKMRKLGIVPTGQGLHTIPKP